MIGFILLVRVKCKLLKGLRFGLAKKDVQLRNENGSLMESKLSLRVFVWFSLA